MDFMSCTECGSNDTEIYPAEFEDEDDVLHCYDCGADEPL
ncbi:hypothetical protein SEA_PAULODIABOLI_348 [Microbacterium phage PauloDiaboli]|nr:hypothetical protein SEA_PAULODIABOLI_348 [Microbacterium phage PauloDiaboli]